MHNYDCLEGKTPGTGIRKWEFWRALYIRQATFRRLGKALNGAKASRKKTKKAQNEEREKKDKQDHEDDIGTKYRSRFFVSERNPLRSIPKKLKK